ncbi:uncharacterized protein [Fopius arisanus]|uniref:Uncharacterized protein n=3 Tax=Fopius arisanus TaxID=64838 RepID=A0A9R1TVC2_9HYME|nr:PREDICTED: uncharacterized protein LOC105263194 [Fopius arisanus]
MRPEGPRSLLQSTIPRRGSIHKPKHVSFARSHTLTSFDVAPISKSPPRAQNPERLIDSQPTLQATLPPVPALYPPPEPKILVLGRRGIMKTQATQTDIANSRRPPLTLSPRTIHRVKMVSQGAQTNGIINGRKLTKSFSEAGQFGGPLGEEKSEHEPLQRTQSEEPPRSPFLVDTPPASPRLERLNEHLLNGDIERVRDKYREDDEEILIDFKPAPVSPDARAMLQQMPVICIRPVRLIKTLSDGEIRVERRELIDEAGAPSYPHTCRRNYHDPWSRSTRPPIQFSSTPDDLSLLRTSSPLNDHREEVLNHQYFSLELLNDDLFFQEFHENIIRRGLFRKRSISLEDGVQDLHSSDFSLPRSLPTSPTSPTATPAHRVAESPRYAIQRPNFLRTCPIIGTASSPFASSDSLTNDVTKDHSDGIWNESQATVLQADCLALLTPSSRRRHLLLLQHQQRSSMDTEALDVEDELELSPPSPRIRLQTATPIILTPNDPPLLVTNGRPRSGLLRRSPGPPYSQPQSQSSSEIALSLGRTDSGRTLAGDLSEASTTEDYVTANTSTGTGNTTGTSATPSSWSRPGLHYSSSTAPSGPTSTTATAADGSSFESASSIYSLARSEAVVEEPASPKAIVEELEVPLDLSDIVPPSPARSTSSSSSGSYDLEDAMPEPPNESYQTAPLSGHTSDVELEQDEYCKRLLDHRRLSSGGYIESPPDPPGWTEEERRKRRKTFTLDFQDSLDLDHSHQDKPEGFVDSADVSPTPSHRHRPRGKNNANRGQYRNNRRRDSVQSTLSTLSRSPQKEDWPREPIGELQIPTSDDSSCSHHYHLHHYHHPHHLHRDNQEGRHRRTRESPRRKAGGHNASRRKSNEDKNAAITGSLPRRRTRPPEDVCSSRLSPGGRYQRGSGHNGHTTVLVKSPSPEARLKALSAESLRSVSPGSDSVFYSEGADQSCLTAHDSHHCHNCGKEVTEEIVQPPAGFADSPEGPRTAVSKHASHRLYKKFDKRYRSEDRAERRYHRNNGRSDARAKSEERGGRSSSRGSIEDGIRRRLQARSTDVSMETLAYREDEDSYVEPYTGNEWIYIGELEESHVWKRPDSRDGDDESSEGPIKDRRGSQGSTESEKGFQKKYQAATHRMVHRKSSGEMYKRIQSKSFGVEYRSHNAILVTAKYNVARCYHFSFSDGNIFWTGIRECVLVGVVVLYNSFGDSVGAQVPAPSKLRDFWLQQSVGHGGEHSMLILLCIFAVKWRQLFQEKSLELHTLLNLLCPVTDCAEALVWIRRSSIEKSLSGFGNYWGLKVSALGPKMVCDSAGADCPPSLGEDISLKKSLEEVLKCMLRVWCREEQALTKLGSTAHESDKTVIVKREAGGEFGFRIHGSKPVVVSAIEPDTPAESSGLEVGDIIMSVNGRSVMDATHSEVVRLAHSGPDVLELEVARTCNVLAPRVSRGPKETVETPLCSGYLWRKATTVNSSGSSSDKWVRRWFALRPDNCLYYYKTDTDSQPVGAVMLLKYEVETTPDVKSHSFVIRKQGAPSHHLAADNEDSMQKWITVIRDAVQRNNQADTWLDASLRMQQMPANAIQRPDCFGYLSKQQDRARKTSSPTGWSRRYCVLKDAALYFYDDANAEKAFGVACLHGFRVHGSAPNSGGRKHAFELQPPDPTQRSYTFASDSEMEKKRWLAALEYSIDRWIKVG